MYSGSYQRALRVTWYLHNSGYTTGRQCNIILEMNWLRRPAVIGVLDQPLESEHDHNKSIGTVIALRH